MTRIDLIISISTVVLVIAGGMALAALHVWIAMPAVAMACGGAIVALCLDVKEMGN